MTRTKTARIQLDKAQDSWISKNRSENRQIISYKLEEFATNLENVSTGEIARVKQYHREAIPWTLISSISTENFNYIQFNSPVKQSGDSADKFFDTDLDLDARTNTYCEQSSKALLNQLLDMGIAWIHIAKMINVRAHIVRDLDFGKDNCENLPKEPHTKLAQLLALIEKLSEILPNQNIPSWLETTLDGYYYSGIDVISEGQRELLVQYAYGKIHKIELLDKCFPNWEDSFDSRIEVFTASDGERAIRLRSDNLED